MALSGVATIVRMTAIKLSSGGLLIYSPIAPTRECIELVRDLGMPVEYLVLSTFAYEHKIYIPPFNRAFKEAKVWAAPAQWSVPVPLPLPLLGIFAEGTIQDDSTPTPFSEDLEHKVLNHSLGIRPYSEVAMLHKATGTVLLTDAVVWIPSTPPEIMTQQDLYSAGGDLPEVVLAFSKGSLEKASNKMNKPPHRDDERKLRGGQM